MAIRGHTPFTLTFGTLVMAFTLTAWPWSLNAQSQGCKTPEINVTADKPSIIAYSDNDQGSILYIHSNTSLKGLQVKVSSFIDSFKLWVPYTKLCFPEQADWYEIASDCEMEPNTEFAICNIHVTRCEFTCKKPLQTAGELSFSITAHGASYWRHTEPPEYCKTVPSLRVPIIKFEACFPYPNDTTDPARMFLETRSGGLILPNASEQVYELPVDETDI